MFCLDGFINEYVTKRRESMFATDIELNKRVLQDRIEGKTVLVIGGAGSIGSSFIKAILPYHPASLTVVDINENALAELTRDIRSSKGVFVPKEYITYPMDYASTVFEKMFCAHNGFDIIGNFSAHKHVRSEKDVYSIEALLQNNVFNAKKFLELLSFYPPQVYFCVSTDKAANPVNVMGASKRIMEDVIFSYSDAFAVKTARFANVAFSNGSLPAGFMARISKLQPISAPSDVKRYFVSPEESGQICLLAAILGENREIFFPKLKEAQMTTFDSIACDLLSALGYAPVECASEMEAIEKSQLLKNGGNQYPVYFSVSNTSGEKEFEEFVTDYESADYGRFASLGVIVNKQIPSRNKIEQLMFRLKECMSEGVTKEDIISIIKGYLPNFNHIETGKSLDSKM